MSGGQEKNFSTLGPKLRGNKAQQDNGDKQRQICIEVINYQVSQNPGAWNERACPSDRQGQVRSLSEGDHC